MTDTISQLENAPQEVLDAYRRLTPRMRKLAMALPTAKSQEDAALAAGYAASTARANAHVYASHPDVRAVTDYIMGTAIKTAVLTIDDCLRELAKLVGADPQGIFDANGALLPPGEWPETTSAAICEVQQADLYAGVGEAREKIGVTNKIKFVDKASTLNLAFKLLDAFPEKKKQVTHTHRVGLVVVPQKQLTQHAHMAIEGEAQRIEQPPKKGNAPAFMVRRVKALQPG